MKFATKFLKGFAVGVLFMAAPGVQAWNNVGHRVIAELVWRDMTPSERSGAAKLLREHPHYKSILTERVPAGVGKDEWAFLTAAVWPDMVRKPKVGQPKKPESVTRYDLYPHAIGFPIVWPENRGKISVEHFSVGKPNAEEVLSNCLATLRNTRETPQARAVALCWVLHLTGDLHQPLHAATIVTPQKPHGDSLGGDYFVVGPNGRKLHLHAFWDELAGIEPSYKSVMRAADEIAANAELKADKLTEYQRDRTVVSWVQESYEIAAGFAYDRQRVRYAHIDDLKAGKVKESEIPKVDPKYVEEARRIAFRRLALAGLRAREELRGVW